MIQYTRPAPWGQPGTPGFPWNSLRPMPVMETGAGRGMADDTPIPTPDGWTTVGEIAVGQQAFDERGEPCTVLGVHP